jgi:hypothetical protein
MTGNVKLVVLKVRDVGFALGALAQHLSTRSVRLARMILTQASRNTMVNDLVVRNVAEVATVPAGQPERRRPVMRTAGPPFGSRGRDRRTSKLSSDCQ